MNERFPTDVAPDATIGQRYGCTDFPEFRGTDCTDPKPFFHCGIDLPAVTGTKVFATRAGVVVAMVDDTHNINLDALCGREGLGSIREPSLGENAVCVRVDEQLPDGTTRQVFIEYGHLDSSEVREGQQVKVGHLIGRVGTRGASCGPHLHLEVRTDGPTQGKPQNTLDPSRYMYVEEDMSFTDDDRHLLQQLFNLLVAGDAHGDGTVLAQSRRELKPELDQVFNLLRFGDATGKGDIGVVLARVVPSIDQLARAVKALSLRAVDIDAVATAVAAKLPGGADPKAIAKGLADELESRVAQFR